MDGINQEDGARRWRWLLIVLAAAAAVRLAVLVVPAEPLPDAGTYAHLASGLVERGELREADGNRARVVPGYPLFLAGCRAAFGSSDLAWRLPQALIGFGTVLAVYLLARRLFGSGAGLAAAGLAAVDPFAVGFGAQMLTEGLALFILVGTALPAWQARGAGEGRRPSALLLWAAGAGLVAGLGMLARPAVGLMGLLLILGAFILPGADRPRLRSALARGALALAVCLAVLSPWAIRNWQVLGAFVPFSTDGGQSLYEGNSPNATGGPAVPETVGVRLREALAMSELERDRLLRREARAWIAEHPGRFARLAVVKFARTWSPLPNFDAYRSWRYMLPSLLAWTVVMGLAGLGIWGLGFRVRGSGFRTEPAGQLAPNPEPRTPNPAIWFCLLPVIFVAVAHMIWIGSVRYRMPAWPFLEILAGAGAAWLYERFIRRWRKTETTTAGSPAADERR